MKQLIKMFLPIATTSNGPDRTSDHPMQLTARHALPDVSFRCCIVRDVNACSGSFFVLFLTFTCLVQNDELCCFRSPSRFPPQHQQVQPIDQRVFEANHFRR